MNGSYQPMKCCDAECAGVNHCRIGGLQCAKCGRYFCAGDINEDDLCYDCAGEEEE